MASSITSKPLASAWRVTAGPDSYRVVRFIRRGYATCSRDGESNVMVLIQLLLPTDRPAHPDTSGPLAQTRRELTEQFRGLTAYVRSPARGSWTPPDGRTDQDDVVMVEVVAERFDRAWWRDYSTTLAARFNQERIHLRAMQVELLEEGIDE